MAQQIKLCETKRILTKNIYHSLEELLTQPDMHKLLGIKWYHCVRNSDVRWKTEQPHLSATVQARRVSLFGHIV